MFERCVDEYTPRSSMFERCVDETLLFGLLRKIKNEELQVGEKGKKKDDDFKL